MIVVLLFKIDGRILTSIWELFQLYRKFGQLKLLSVWWTLYNIHFLLQIELEIDLFSMFEYFTCIIIKIIECWIIFALLQTDVRNTLKNLSYLEMDLFIPVGKGCKIHRPNLCWVLDRTPNNLMVRIHFWSSGKYGIPLYYHFSKVLSNPER